jgi:hypothetical protein
MPPPRCQGRCSARRWPNPAAMGALGQLLNSTPPRFRRGATGGSGRALPGVSCRPWRPPRLSSVLPGSRSPPRGEHWNDGILRVSQKSHASDTIVIPSDRGVDDSRSQMTWCCIRANSSTIPGTENEHVRTRCFCRGDMAMARMHVPLRLRAHELDDRASSGPGQRRRYGSTTQAGWRRQVWSRVKSGGSDAGFAATKP